MSKMKKTTVVIACIAMMAILAVVGNWFLGLHSGIESVRGYKCDDYLEVIYEKPQSEQKDIFCTYDIEQQYAIYICGNHYIHPPLIYLAEPFASEGEDAVGFLKARILETKDNDPVVEDIVLVFAAMAIQNTYDVAGDKDLMRILNQKVNRITNPNIKNTAELYLGKITQKRQR